MCVIKKGKDSEVGLTFWAAVSREAGQGGNSRSQNPAWEYDGNQWTTMTSLKERSSRLQSAF